MKLAETCPCGASITAEGAPLTVRQEVTVWRTSHPAVCTGEQYRRNAASVAQPMSAFGFIPAAWRGMEVQ